MTIKVAEKASVNGGIINIYFADGTGIKFDLHNEEDFARLSGQLIVLNDFEGPLRDASELVGLRFSQNKLDMPGMPRFDRFDRVAYRREYMRRRAKLKAEKEAH